MCLLCITVMSGPSLFYQSWLRGQQPPSPGSTGVWLELHGVFRLGFAVCAGFNSVLVNLLSIHPSLARCFEASLSRSGASQSGFRCCASARPCCGIQHAVTMLVAPSLRHPQRCVLCRHPTLSSSLPGLSLANAPVSA